MKEYVFFTNCKWFTRIEPEEQFGGSVSFLNWQILLAHITILELASYIKGFTEQNGKLFFLIDVTLISIDLNLRSQIFSK
ncbi:MAG: hypothetical protein ABSF81_16165 [Bacteroidales bacterium]